MKTTLSFILALLVLQALVVAAPSTRPATQPATLPADRKAEIDRLVANLGDDNPKVRQDATEALRKIGKDALPALADARQNNDLEISTRAESITRLIEEDINPKPKPSQTPDRFGNMPGGIFRVGPGNAQVRVQGNIIMGGGNGQMRIAVAHAQANGVKDISVTENDRTVRIHEDKDGITVSVTEPNKDGKEETKEYKAKDAETLKKEHPEGHKLYEKYSAQGGVIQIQGFQLNGIEIQGAGGAIDPNLPNNAQREEMLKRARKQVEEAKLQAEKMRAEALKQMEEAKRRAEQQADQEKK